MNFIPHWIWNQKYVEPHAACVALPGARTRVSYTPQGQIIDLTSNALWRHPWFTDPRWNAKTKQWEATVRSGFISGEDPLVPGIPSPFDKEKDCDLVDNPVIPLNSFRSVPGEGDPLPPFFKALGVREPKNDLSISAVGGVTFDTTEREDENPLPPRALVAMDFYIAVARATYQGDVTVSDVSGTTGQVVDYSVSFDTTQLDQKGSRPRLQQASKFPEIRPPTFAERLLGTFQDEGEDRILVSTVFLLSPPNVLDSPLDGTWTPYVKHNTFWNLSHVARNLPPARPAKPIRLFTGLLGGLADLIFNQALTPLNELADKVNNAVTTTSNEGKFWSI